MADPRPSAEEKKLERLRASVARLNEVVEAARVLAAGWEASGFYDRQDAAQALALHEALTTYESGEK